MLETIDAILMASGFSRRFGNSDKLLQPVGGKPLALRALELVCGLPFKTVHFVAAGADVLRLGEGFPVRTRHNTSPERGQCESVRLGVLASNAEHYMFFVCDQPFLDAETVLSICGKAAPGKIVFPVYGGKPGSPNLFSKAFREELLALKDGENARTVKSRHPGALIRVPAASGRALADIDTYEDFKALGD
ncbi:MAG: nucleotidyltransferase family protein [Peptococcaceae bacterium]|nr:nucleotidyltransferase family protein [Peptococcaceae bacterium]